MSIRNIVHKYQGDEDVHPHPLRHSFAVYCLKQGVNIRALQKILGHSNLDTTAIYLDLIADDLKTEMKKIQW
jgi:integrase/recombinase XerD